MFASRDTRAGAQLTVDVAFTDRWGGRSEGTRATLDLSRLTPQAGSADEANWSALRAAFGVAAVVGMRQVHGADVVRVPLAGADADTAAAPECDALVTTTPGLALCVRVADCVPVLLADPWAGVAGAAHAGRRGIAAGLLAATVQEMRACGADRIEAWVGPHICGGCYEVPFDMRRDVAVVTPAAFCCTTTGTPSLDLGAAAATQLVAAGCTVAAAPARCTMESDDLFSYRRQGADSGRLAGLVVLRGTTSPADHGAAR